jgi:SOS-response transcriptional repressor LexA
MRTRSRHPEYVRPQFLSSDLAADGGLDGGAVLGWHATPGEVPPVIDMPALDLAGHSPCQLGLGFTDSDRPLESATGCGTDAAGVLDREGISVVVSDHGEQDSLPTLAQTHLQDGRPKSGMPSRIGKFVANWRAERGISTRELADRVGVTRQNIEQLESGAVKQPRYLSALAVALGMTVEELLSGADSAAHRSRHNAVPASATLQRIPVLTSPLLCAWDHAGPILGTSDSLARVPTLADVGPKGFAVRVQGDSMLKPSGSPSFPEGTLLYVSPSREARSGDYVVARTPGDQLFIFKRLTIEAGRRLLEPLNPRFPVLDLPPDGVICGVVVSAELPLV